MPPRKKFTRDKLLPPYKRAPLEYGTFALIVLGDRGATVALHQNLGSAIKATSNYKGEPSWIVTGPAHKITALVKKLEERKERLDTSRKVEVYVAKLLELEDEMSVADRSNMPFDTFLSEADESEEQPFVEDAEWRDRVTSALSAPCRYSLDKYAVQEAEHMCKKIPGNEPVLKWMAIEKVMPTVANEQFDTSRVHLFESLVKSGKPMGPIIIDNDGKIFDGKHRWMGAKRAQVKKVPVMFNSVDITSLYDTGFASADIDKNPIWARIDATTKLACSACNPIADSERGYMHFTVGSSDSDEKFVRKVAIQANEDTTFRVHLVQVSKADFSSKVLKKAARVPADELSTFIGFMIR
jgi:hypothetical protein